MFEEFLEHRRFLQTSSKRSQLAHLIKAQTTENVVEAIERDLPTGHLTHQQKQLLRRRITEEYAKQPIPESTFETWHSLTEAAGENSQEEENPSDSDENRDARHPSGRKKRKKKRLRVTKSDEYTEGDFDMYVKEKLVKEMTASQSGAQQTQESPQEQQLELQDDIENMSPLDSDEELDLHPDTIYARQKLHDLRSGAMTSNLAPQAQWAIDRFIAMSWGWDVAGASHDISDYSLIKLHVRSLRILLHASILKRKWQSAFKVFCVLVRFDWVDKRAIWPLGMEILTQRKRELLAVRKLPKLEMNKETQFLEWISLLYPAARVKFISTRTYQGPVYRSGSRTHAPLSIITGLWHLLVEQKYSRVRELLDDMLLHPPYASDGAYPFLLAMCCMAENQSLINMFQKFDLCGGFFEDTQEVGDLADEPGLLSSKETMKTRIFNNNAQTRKMLDECDKLGFQYPREELEARLDETWELLGLRNSNKDRNSTHSESDDEAEIRNGNGPVPENGEKPRAMISRLNVTSKETEMKPEEALSLLDALLDSSDAQHFESVSLPESNGFKDALATETAQMGSSTASSQKLFEQTDFTPAKMNSENPRESTKSDSSNSNSPYRNGVEEIRLVHNGSQQNGEQQSPLEERSEPKSPELKASYLTSLGSPTTPKNPRSPSASSHGSIRSSAEDSTEEETNTKIDFSPTSSLPTQNSQKFGQRAPEISNKEEEWVVTTHPEVPDSDYLEREDNVHNSDEGVPENEHETTRFEDAVEEQSNHDAFPDSSDSESERYQKGHHKRAKKNKPMEMEFDFDF